MGGQSMTMPRLLPLSKAAVALYFGPSAEVRDAPDVLRPDAHLPSGGRGWSTHRGAGTGVLRTQFPAPADIGNGSNRSTVDDDGHECHSKIRGPVLKNPRSDIYYRLSDLGGLCGLRISSSGRPRRRGSDRKPAVNNLPGCKLHNGELAQSCWSPRKKKGWWWRVALQRRFARTFTARNSAQARASSVASFFKRSSVRRFAVSHVPPKRTTSTGTMPATAQRGEILERNHTTDARYFILNGHRQ